MSRCNDFMTQLISSTTFRPCRLCKTLQPITVVPHSTRHYWFCPLPKRRGLGFWLSLLNLKQRHPCSPCGCTLEAARQNGYGDLACCFNQVLRVPHNTLSSIHPAKQTFDFRGWLSQAVGIIWCFSFDDPSYHLCTLPGDTVITWRVLTLCTNLTPADTKSSGSGFATESEPGSGSERPTWADGSGLQKPRDTPLFRSSPPDAPELRI